MLAAAPQVRGQPADIIELWPGSPPGGPGPQGAEQISGKGSLTNISRPRLVAYRPGRSNRTAIIVIAGGGYAHINAGTESTPMCRWLQANGTTAFELIYRLPWEGWSPAAPFADGQQAMRIVRAGAAANGLDSDRIGMIGFSAGGHLAGMTAVRADEAMRPDFCGLIYPVITMMPPFDRTHARREIIGSHPTLAQSEANSVERHVGPGFPPTFLAQAADDPISPVDNSLMMFDALRAAKVAAELHVFQFGGHGWGMGQPGTEVHAWPALFTKWAVQNAFLPSL